MKRIFKLIWAPMFLAVAFLAGCGAERDEQPEESAQGAPLFEKNKGVLLPAEMKQELGIETVDVAERPSTWRLEKAVQIFRASDETRPAAAVARLNDAEAQRLRPGQSVTLRASDGTSNMVAGTIARLESPANSALGQVEAVIEIPQAAPGWRPGSFLTATFSAAYTNVAQSVPESAVIHGVGGAFVFVANGEHYVRTPVKLGATADGWLEITDGLYAGDIVVARGADALWLIELCALKGGTPCCPVPAKKQEK